MSITFGLPVCSKAFGGANGTRSTCETARVLERGHKSSFRSTHLHFEEFRS